MSETALGKFYGIGVGPGDPELLTVRGAKLIGSSKVIVAPKASSKSVSLARDIASRYIRPDAEVIEMVFPMARDLEAISKSHRECARRIASYLIGGLDVCYLTLGDPMIYSTYIYLLDELKKELPEVDAETVPGVSSFCAAAAEACYPLGRGGGKLAILPVKDNLSDLKTVLGLFETVVLMKVADKLPELVEILEEMGLAEGSVLVSRAGLPGGRIVKNLLSLKGADQAQGYLSVILTGRDR